MIEIGRHTCGARYILQGALRPPYENTAPPMEQRVSVRLDLAC